MREGDRQNRVRQLEKQIAEFDELKRICAEAYRSVEALIQLAEKPNQIAFGTLLLLTSRMAIDVGSIARKRPKIARRFTRESHAWPGLISRKRFLKKQNEKLIADLQLGKGGRISEGGWQFGARSDLAALWILSMGDRFHERGLVSRLTGKNKKMWFEKVWNFGFRNGESSRTIGLSSAAWRIESQQEAQILQASSPSDATRQYPVRDQKQGLEHLR